MHSINYKTPLNPIRLGEFDLGGVLYHANYFHLLEEIRESFLRSVYCPYSELSEEGIHLAITNSELNFLKPIKYGQDLIGEINVERIKKTGLKFYYKIFDQKNSNLIFSGSTSHVTILINNLDKSHKVIKLPVKLENIFN